MSRRVVVVGGGIVGALSAYEAVKSGLAVTLVDAQTIGMGASGNSAAMLECQLDAHRGEPFFSLARASLALFPSLCAELQALTGVDPEFEACGIVEVALTPVDAELLRAEVRRQRDHGLDCAWLSAEETARRFPFIESKLFGAAAYNGDGQVNGERFLSAAVQAARQRGANIIEDAADSAIIVREGRVTGVRANGRDLEADVVVVAAGAWTDRVLAPLGLALGIAPIRGQLLVYDAPRSTVAQPIYTKRGGYLTPKRAYLLAGTTVENVGFDSRVTDEGRASIERLVSGLSSGIAALPQRGATAGLRPRSEDEHPHIGPLPGHANVIVAAGHFRNGVLLAPITAAIVSALAAGRPAPEVAAPFRPRVKRAAPSA